MGSIRVQICLVAFLARFWVAGSAPAKPTKDSLHKKTSGRFLASHDDKRGKVIQGPRRVSLVKNSAKDPGYFPNWGVRGQVDSQIKGFAGSDSKFDSQLDRNFWTGDSMSYDFRSLDNLNPTAPMDRIWTEPGKIKNPDDVIGRLIGFDTGGFSEPAYIPKYINPELFPTVIGSGCNCTMPLKPGEVPPGTTPQPGTQENAMWSWSKDWGRLLPIQKQAAQTLGWKESTWQKAEAPASSKKQWKDLTPAEQSAAGQFGWTDPLWQKRYEALVMKMDPDFTKKLKKSRQDQAAWPSPGQEIKCVCAKGSKTDHYTWLKATPLGQGKYTLTPADTSYRGGDYWDPHAEGGIQSPSDRLPWNSYPNQAPSDVVWPVPVSAREDRMAIKYARYIDQVYARSEECDTVSKKCTTPCAPGDDVVVNMGNSMMSAKISKTYVGNAVEVEFTPSVAQQNAQTVVCPLAAACTAFRFCKNPTKPVPCVKQIMKNTHNWAGNLVQESVCPKETFLCKTVKQVVAGSLLKKNGKACKATYKKMSQKPSR